jgi:CRP-like cAMP-binding protein
MVGYHTIPSSMAVNFSNPKSIGEATHRIFAPKESLPLPEEALWLIDQGLVRTLTWTDQGDVISLGYWGAGELVGLPLAKLSPFQVECVTRTEAVLLPQDQWSYHLDAILDHAQRSAQLASFLAHDRTLNRLAYLIEWLGGRFGRRVSEGVLIDIPLPHSAIGEMVGCSRVTVTRFLGALQKQGALVQLRRRIILLKNLNDLDFQEITANSNPRRRASDLI